MSIPVLRTADAWWVRHGDVATRVDTEATTTAGLLAESDALEKARTQAASGTAVVPVDELALRSPVSTPCRVVAQMTNFRSHVTDAGMDPASIPLTFFRKSSGSVSGPHDDVVKPAHVRLLDYEVEIGLVVGEPLAVGDDVDDAALRRHVAALVVTNDVSARDVQLPQTQFYEGKSYPTFTPVGPVLLVLEEGDLDRFDDLHLRLWVNGELRQESRVEGDMIYPPLEALRSLSRFQALDTGDLILTGTPVGTALSAPPKVVEIVGSLLPPATKWKLFFKRQGANPKYLRDGDVVEASVATADGSLDLGAQRLTVRCPA